jgi:hypothetical protein
MRRERDPLFQMLDSVTADRILDGAVAAPDAPPGYERAVALLTTLAELPASPDRLPDAGTVGTPTRRWRARQSPRRRAAIVAISVAAIIPATAGAAYANVLPDSVDHPLMHLMHRVGLTTAPNQERNDPQPVVRKIAEPPASLTQSTGDTKTNPPAAGPSASPDSKATPSTPPVSKDADPPPSSITPPTSPAANTTAGAAPIVPTPHASPKLPPQATDRPTPSATDTHVPQPILPPSRPT